MITSQCADVIILGFDDADLRPQVKYCMGLEFQTNGYKEKLNFVRKLKHAYEQEYLETKGTFIEVDDALLYNGPIDNIPETLFKEEAYLDILDKLLQTDCKLCIIYWRYD